MDERDLRRIDQDILWHPYASMPNSLPAFPVESASGVRIRLKGGRDLIDGMSSWWAAIHGYRHPRLDRAMKAQLDRLPHVMFGGLTHEPAAELGRRLVRLTPDPLTKVFLCDSGSVSVEVAIKMALQFCAARSETAKRTKLATIRGGYHGDTLGAMAVCDPVNGMHGLFRGILPKHHFVGRPEPRFGETLEPHHTAELATLFEEQGHEIAALILEPVVQGAGGMWFYSPDYLVEARRLCDQHGVLLIFDEIATGFGRSGELFAAHHARVSPDILCVGKALTGGVMSLAATLSTDHVAETISSASPGSFMHGPTFMANPLACSAAVESIDLLLESSWQERVRGIESQLKQELEPCRQLEQVDDVRVLGAIGVIETKEPVDMSVVQPAFVERGVWIRPFGKLVYTMPPYVIDSEDLSRVTHAMVDVVTRHCV